MAYRDIDPGSEQYAAIMDRHAVASRIPIHGGMCCCGRVRVYSDGSGPNGHGRELCRRPERAK